MWSHVDVVVEGGDPEDKATLDNLVPMEEILNRVSWKSYWRENLNCFDPCGRYSRFPGVTNRSNRADTVTINYRERNKYRVRILMALTDKMSLDNSTLDFPLRMPIYIPNFGRRGLGNYLIMLISVCGMLCGILSPWHVIYIDGRTLT